MTEIPITCTLSAADKSSRGDEWRRFLAVNVAQFVRSDTAVRMKLNDGDDVILTAVDLARREKDCCAFFDFRLELLPDAIWLEVGAPDEAASLLDALVETGTA